MTRQIHFKVAGVTFAAGYPQNLHDLKPTAEVAFARGEGLPAVLRRNPANAYDANAIEIHVPTANQMIGHMPKDLAARCAPQLDAGIRFGCEVWSVDIDPAHPDRPGVTVRVWLIEDQAPSATDSRPEATNHAANPAA